MPEFLFLRLQFGQISAPYLDWFRGFFYCKKCVFVKNKFNKKLVFVNISTFLCYRQERQNTLQYEHNRVQD